MIIKLQALPSASTAVLKLGTLTLGATPTPPLQSIASLSADTESNTVSFTLAPWIPVKDVELSVHGFVPRGWKTDRLAVIPLDANSPNGMWHYGEVQEKNILAGLAYFVVRNKADGSFITRAQIEPVEKATPKLEAFVTVTGLAGNCGSSITIDGILNDVQMEMSPAQVLMARTGAVRNVDGKLEQTIGCAVRVGNAKLPGIGNIQIQMFGDENPGKVESMTGESDFPAKMSLDVHKRYLTPLGNFYTDTEQFEAENIAAFPPFGVRFKPVVEKAPLKHEITKREVGFIKLGWLVPLFYLDRADFPAKLPLNLEEGEEK